MVLKSHKSPAGTLVVFEHIAKILKDNPLGDPHVRKLAPYALRSDSDNPKRDKDTF